MTLSIRSLSKTYNGPKGKTIHVLEDCSFQIESGSFTVIAGRSGCGKTTLLKIIAGLEQADSGTVEFGEDAAQPKIGFMLQDPRLLPWLTIEQNLALAFPPPKDKIEKAPMQNKIFTVLAMVGIADRALSPPRELSGGMAQRAALARCLCRDPDLLLLDEPLSSLDAFTRHRLREELEKLWLELGLTIILVTHDSEDAVFFGGNVLLLNEGAIQSKLPIPLSRPRNCRTPEFQE
jgi:sulfonate transport system ATP-binding protein